MAKTKQKKFEKIWLPTLDDWEEHIAQVVIPYAKKRKLKVDENSFGGEIDVDEYRLMYHPWVLDGCWFLFDGLTTVSYFDTAEEAIEHIVSLKQSVAKPEAKAKAKKVKAKAK